MANIEAPPVQQPREGLWEFVDRVLPWVRRLISAAAVTAIVAAVWLHLNRLPMDAPAPLPLAIFAIAAVFGSAAVGLVMLMARARLHAALDRMDDPSYRELLARKARSESERGWEDEFGAPRDV